MQIETPGGVIDGTNKDFTLNERPKSVVVDQQTYFEGKGYTIIPMTIHMDIAPASGAEITAMR